MSRVEGGDLLHFVVCQLEVENRYVFCDVVRVLGARNGNVARLHMPAQHHLCGRFPVSLRYLCDNLVPQDVFGVAAPAQRVIRFTTAPYRFAYSLKSVFW